MAQIINFLSSKRHSIANSSLFPTSLYLHSNSTQILALKKRVFWKKKILPKKNKYFFYLFSMQLFSADAIAFSKKFKKFFFDPEKVKKQASKVAHNRPRPLYFTVQPRPMVNSPELILHIEKSRDQRSVLLSVLATLIS